LAPKILKLVNKLTGVILKDVSLEVHGGELTAVLGSKGTGNTCKFGEGTGVILRMSP
jgi:ABC-type lipopolysaccharide export system ATPase subunit